MEPKEKLLCNAARRFGVELEVNSFDGKSKPEGDLLPAGIEYVGNLIAKTTGENTVITKWGYDRSNNNRDWVIKPDASCGIEVCSPVLKGNLGLQAMAKATAALRDAKISVDHRCSFHVHIEVADCSLAEVAKILTYWVKCELVFVDSVPAHRKKNRYSQLVAVGDMLEHDSSYSPDVLIALFGNSKYYTVNTYHMMRQRRRTLEFRIAEGDVCVNPESAINWVRLLLHFVEMAKKHHEPGAYRAGDKWSSFLLLDPLDVFEFLGFDGSYDLSAELQEVKKWFLKRLTKNINCFSNISEKSFWSTKSRQIAIEQVNSLNSLFS